jgi:hypothetical protein
MPSPSNTDDHSQQAEIETALEVGYRDMAADVARETDAMQWVIGFSTDLDGRN